ncbi:MAG: hypothetical protein IPP72_00620 [Chitinophagaceae bacterium]|nr:hypothetical protein [Chitinophagaceae bacterium]
MRLTLLSLLLFTGIVLHAQENKTIDHIGWKGNTVQLHTIGNGHQSCTFVMNEDSVKAFFHDGKPAPAELFTVPRVLNEAFLGGFIQKDSIVLFMNNGKRPGIHTWKYNLAVKSITENVVPFEIKENKILHRLSSENHFFYFTANNKAKELVIYKFNDEKNYELLHYPLVEKTWDRLLKQKGSAFSKPEVDIEKTDMEGECSVEAAQCANKIYVRSDTLYLLMNHKPAVTEVLTIDLNNNSEQTRFITHNSNRIISLPGTVFNSFLSKDRLYYAAASDTGVFVQVSDFYSGMALKEYFAAKEDEISFKNSPIVQEKGAFANNRELDKTKQLLRKMMNSSLVITATQGMDNKLSTVLVGSYKPVSNNPGLGVFIPLGGSGPFLYSYLYVPVGGFARNNGMKTANFKMQVDMQTGEQVPGEIPPSQISKFHRTVKTSLNSTEFIIMLTMIKGKEILLW